MVSRKGTSARSGACRRRMWRVAPHVRRAAGALVMAGGLLVGARSAGAQTGQPGVEPSPKHQEGALLALGQNYPSPFSAATRIPFTVGDPPVCSDAGRRYHVSLRIYNLLAQLVAVPVMAEGATSVAPVGQPVQSLELACGQYTAYWDGTALANSREVASGLYLYRLDVNGKAVVRKMMIQR
jgi:hypothetical protein